MALEVACECGTVLQAASADSLLDDAYLHVDTLHPEIPDSLRQIQVLRLMRSSLITAPQTEAPFTMPEELHGLQMSGSMPFTGQAESV